MKVWVGCFSDDGEQRLMAALTEDYLYCKLWKTCVWPLVSECHCDDYVGFDCSAHGLKLEKARDLPKKVGYKKACEEIIEACDWMMWDSLETDL